LEFNEMATSTRVRVLLSALLIASSLIGGCGGKIVNITSSPTAADVYSNRDRIGNTPLLTSKDEIMPLWSSDGVFTRAVITLRKTGYQDFKVFVDEMNMPDVIDAKLIPNTPSEIKERQVSNEVFSAKETVENRLSVLKQLLDNGTITNEEYQSKRKEILEGL
jgi:hypothetical protein